MTIATPFVAVDDCKGQLEHYRKILGGEAVVLRAQDDLVLNAELRFGASKITFADTRAAQPTAKGDYTKVMVHLETEEEFLRVHGELAAGGRIDREAYEAPFNGLIAIVTDRNGVGWVLAYRRP